MTMRDPYLVVDRYPTSGANPARVRNHNERAILSLLRKRKSCAGSAIARHLDLSAQTASVIIRRLEDQGLVQRLVPVGGKVGKPLEPVALNPHGAYAFGLRIGRRTSRINLINILGQVIADESVSYNFPTPDAVEDFAVKAMARMINGDQDQARVVGIGVALPFELWNWLDGLGAPRSEAEKWKHHPIGERLAKQTGLPTYVANDVNLACMGELLFGAGNEFDDFAYFYVGYFVGGAFVLGGRVFHGPSGNAGAFGSISVTADGRPRQLIHTSSLYGFERQLASALGHPINLRTDDRYWFTDIALRDQWIDRAADGVAQAIIAVAAILDVSTVIIDGVFPNPVRAQFVDRVRDALDHIDRPGIGEVTIKEGSLGDEAGQRGAAYQPIHSELLIEGSRLI